VSDPIAHYVNAVYQLNQAQHQDRLYLREIKDQITQRRRECQPTSDLVNKKKKVVRKMERRKEDITRMLKVIDKRKEWKGLEG